MRHAILGAGGVGGLIGVALAKSGESVTLVLRPEALKDYPAELSLRESAWLIQRAGGSRCERRGTLRCAVDHGEGHATRMPRCAASPWIPSKLARSFRC